MLTVSSRFRAAEQADVNQIASKIYLVLGNYASASAYGATASASSTDSSDYPAAGAIDGDRTELNVGPASGADNDVGLSSWRSATAPSVTPQTLTIDMGASRTINRLKLYHLASHGLKSFKLESSPDNVTYTLIAKTTDQGGTIATTSQLDTVDFSDVTCRYVKLTVADTVVAADKANVVELEIYRRVEISDRVTGAAVDRSLDYKLTNPLASSFQIDCDNADRFFSFSHTPTAAEASAGFVNSELKPGIGIIIEYGFAYGGGSPDLVTVFSGNVDRISINPADRSARIEGRDAMKFLINQVISSKLKTSQDIKACIQYALNLANISTWETALDTTTLTVDYFFISNQSVMTVIRDLVQASADAQFYFDESGIATFKYYVNSTPQSHTDSSQSDFAAGTVKTNVDTDSQPGQIGRKWFLIDDFADNNFNSNPVWTNRTVAQTDTDDSESDWEAGSVLTNIDTTSVAGDIRRKWFLIDDFSDGDYTSNPAWNVFNGNYSSFPPFPTNRWSVSGGQLLYTQGSSTDVGRASIPFSGGAYGTWECKVTFDTGGVASGYMEVFFVANSFWNTSGPRGQLSSGYCVRLDKSASTFKLQRDDGTTRTDIFTIGKTYDDAQHTLRMVRDPSTGSFDFYWDGVKINAGSINDSNPSPYTTSVYFGFDTVASGLAATMLFDDIYFSYAALTPATAYTGSQAVFESRTFDLTSDVQSLGTFTAAATTPAGTSLSFFTATSADGISWDPYVAVTNGGLILSTARRYFKYKVLMVCPIDRGSSNANVTTPSVQSVSFQYTTVGWKVVSNGLKFSPLTSPPTIGIDTPFLQITGTWRSTFTMTVGSASGEKARMYVMTTGYDVTAATYLSAYYVELDQAAGKIRICKITAGASRSTLLEVAKTITSGVTYSVRLTRTSAGVMELFWNEVSQGTATDTSFSSSAAFAFEVDPNSDQNGNTVVDDVHWSPAVDGTGSISTSQALFESAVVDMGASITNLGIFQATYALGTGTAIAFYTATSADGVSWDAYVAVTNGAAITSAVKRYLKWKAVLVCPIDAVVDGGSASNANVTTPYVFDVTINWFTGTGSPKYPTSVSYVFRSSDLLLDISQEYTDNLGGDSSIINDVDVQAQPLILSGTTADTQWQGTVQTPPVPISGTAPLNVTNGQVLTYRLVIPSGMDTSFMSGASPAAAVVTFGGGASGTWAFTRIHPTRPTLQITITAGGTITDLRVVGKAFTSSNTQSVQRSSDTGSIKLYGDRALSISNPYIVNASIAASIASKLITNYKNPTSYVPGALVRPTFSAQLGDRVTIVDDNTDLDADYVIAGLNHQVSAGVSDAKATTELLLLKVAS